MSEINIKEINKYYGSNHIIKDVSLDIKSQSSFEENQPFWFF